MGGRLLTINEGFGFRPVLTVSSVRFMHQRDAMPPTTIVYGTQVLYQRNDPIIFNTFLRDRFGTKMTWAQVRILQNESEAQFYTIFPRMPLEVILQEELKMVAAGLDPVRGYWVQFAGGPIKLFSQPDWWKQTEDYE